MHEAMDAQTVMELLGVKERMFRIWIAEKGLPCQGTGRNRTFSWPEVLDWYVAYRASVEYGDGPAAEGAAGGEDIRAANLRKTRADADLRELALSRERRKVISIEDAKIRLDRMLGNLRAKLLTMAPKMSARIEGERERTGREAAIKDELENLCRELSTGAVVDLPAAGGEEEAALDLSAAAEEPELDLSRPLLEAYGRLQS